MVALGIGHFRADKSQLERHVRRDWFYLNQKLRHFSDPAEAGSNPADGCHTGPGKPMLFHIFASTEHAVTAPCSSLSNLNQLRIFGLRGL